MSVEIAPEESTIRIPRVCILIPGIHSRQKMEPRYVLPLFKAMWKDSMRDPSDNVRIIDMPPGQPEADKYRVLPLDGACEYEAARLRGEFGLHPRTQEPWFDHVYPGDTFQAAFDAACKEAVTTAGGSTPDALLATLNGVDSATAKKLLEAGIGDIKAVALADVAKLTKILGKTNAENAREDAQFKLNPQANQPNSPIDDKIASVVPGAKPTPKE